MITIAEFEKLKGDVFLQLEEHLAKNLTYHNIYHTKDVLEQSERIANEEGVTDEYDLILLKIAALYHDNGFFKSYRGHEEQSCLIMRAALGNKFSEYALEAIEGMIMATKIPQSPKTLLEQIICDADLDYLGREDFLPISDSLKKEFLAYNIVRNDKEWQQQQISFFETHEYFTKTSNNNRNALKQERLKELKAAFSLQYGL